MRVFEGEKLDCLHVTFTSQPIVGHRDFWFNKEGKFDGTGSQLIGIHGQPERPVIVITQDNEGDYTVLDLTCSGCIRRADRVEDAMATYQKVRELLEQRENKEGSET